MFSSSWTSRLRASVSDVAASSNLFSIPAVAVADAVYGVCGAQNGATNRPCDAAASRKRGSNVTSVAASVFSAAVGRVKGSFFKQRRFLDGSDLERQLC